MRCATALLALSIFAASTQNAAAQTVTWELANEYPASSLAGEGDAYFANLVELRTAGRLHIVPRFDGTAGYKSREQLAAVAAGKIMLADSFAGALGEEDALFLLSSLPFLTPTADDAHRLFEIARPAYEAALSKRGQKLLFVSPWPASGIWARQAVTSAGALRSLVIRTYDKTGVEVMQRAGAKAVNLSFAEVAAKLEAGEINAVLSSGDGGAGRGLWKYLDHFTEINYAVPLSLVTINLAAWNLLDAPTRNVITAAADETMARQWQQMTGRSAQNYQRMREHGMTIEAEVPSQLRDLLDEAATGAIDDWLTKTGPKGRELLERYRANPRAAK
jgi:TRAP-type transport system periplasmic protein